MGKSQVKTASLCGEAAACGNGKSGLEVRRLLLHVGLTQQRDPGQTLSLAEARCLPLRDANGASLPGPAESFIFFSPTESSTESFRDNQSCSADLRG